jgi:CubicO group peptidase (beta-lactamase class C family)
VEKWKKLVLLLALPFATLGCLIAAAAQTIPSGTVIDVEVHKIMTGTHAKGMAVAVIDHGEVGYVQAYGVRNAKGDPLTTDTVMYGASVTKTVFAYTVMQLVDQGKLKLDTPLKDDLNKPLPSYGPDPIFPHKYGPYKDLANDSRWEKITPRMCLTHSTGFNNFWFIEPDHKLHIHFEPGTQNWTIISKCFRKTVIAAFINSFGGKLAFNVRIADDPSRTSSLVA